MDFNIEIPNVEALTEAFAQSPDVVTSVLTKAIAASYQVLAKNKVGNVPVRTGNLLNQWTWFASGLQGIYKPNMSYAPFVEFGTKPHTIVPVKAKALFWPGAAHPVKKVNHPGTKANDFMGRIVADSEPEIADLFVTALDQITAAIAQS